MKKFKSVLATSLVLTTLLSGSQNVFANDNSPGSSNDNPIILDKNGNNGSILIPPINHGGGGYTPKVEVVRKQVFNLANGETNVGFRYTSYASARIYIQNTSKKPVSIEINFPDGTRNLMRTTLSPNQQLEQTFPLYDVYGAISNGLWNIYAYTSDGSAGSIVVAVRTLD